MRWAQRNLNATASANEFNFWGKQHKHLVSDLSGWGKNITTFESWTDTYSIEQFLSNNAGELSLEKIQNEAVKKELKDN